MHARSNDLILLQYELFKKPRPHHVIVEYGTTLETWPGQILVRTSDTVGPPVTVAGTDVTVLIPMGSDPKKFARLNVNIPFTP